MLKLAQDRGLDPLDAELLIALGLKKDRIFVLSRPESKLSPKQVDHIRTLIKKRSAGFPFAYLNGEKEFYGLNFQVKPGVLIPRPETEMIVDYILERFRQEKISLIDLGCGSGSIIIALAKNRPEGDRYLGLDVSPQALKISRYNANRHHLRDKIRFIKSDLLSRVLSSPALIRYLQTIKNQKLIISANLPYLRPQQIKANPELKYEPRLALEAGRDGLKYYRQLLPQAKSLLNLGFSHISLILEIDPSQTEKLKDQIDRDLAGIKKKITIKNDLAGLSRFLMIDLEK